MKFSVITVSFFLAILFLTHSFLVMSDCPEPVPAQYASVRPGKIAAAYFGGWDGHRYNVEDIEPVAPILTHILYAFARPDGKGSTCVLHNPTVDVGLLQQPILSVGGNFEKLIILKKKYPHLKILLSVGGGTYSKRISAIALRGDIKKFAVSIVRLLDAYEYEMKDDATSQVQKYTIKYPGLFDGVDIDWEWLRGPVASKEVAAYHELIKQLYYLLKTRQGKQILTSAMQVNVKIIESLRVENIAKYVDWFNVMAYDYGSVKNSSVSMNAPICNNFSNYSIDYSLGVLMALGVSPAQLVLGIPLYGYVYDNTTPQIGASFEKTDKTRALLYDLIKEKYIDNPNCQTQWHAVSKVPYLYCPDEKIFVSYDDEESIAYKVSYARKKRLKGVFFWRLAGDDQDHTLVKSIKAAL